jgi:hypothetical protein
VNFADKKCVVYSVADPDHPVLFYPWIRDGEKMRIRDEHPGSFFRELKNVFGLTVKFLFLTLDPDRKIRIWDPV